MTDSLHDVVQYALLRLGLEGFCLKEQFLSIKSIYEGNDTFVWLQQAMGRAFVTKLSLLIWTTNEA